MIKIYNTLTRKKEDFIPLEEGKVKMYVCGPTVYNYIHLGNARPIIVFDTVRRYFEYKGYEVTFVQNFTDVDDKIINKANELGQMPSEISERFIKEFFHDAKALHVRKADIHPKVTENMEDIISYIEKLINKEVAYSDEGNVYFETDKFADYGKLSKQSLEDLVAGARIEVNEEKRNPLDFALWKKAKNNEIYWESPWGEGRPGWHIECSTMANKYLGETIDIHAGGADLVFPHHENEIAQTESLTGKQFAKYWMHNGYININNEKMSKSLGNVFNVRELLERYDPLVIRYLVLSVHYRSPINFSEEIVGQAISSIERIKTAYFSLKERIKVSSDLGEKEEGISATLIKLKEQFEIEMDDDFNTANAISVMFELIRSGNKYLQESNQVKQTIEDIMNTMKEWLEVLGLDMLIAEEKDSGDNDWIERLIEERNVAKKNKNWQVADSIRDELSAKGIIIEDTPQGVRWRRK